MKKRLISLLLALTVLCTGILFTGCQGGLLKEKSTYEIINDALKKTQDLESMAAEMKMELGMDVGGMTMSIPATINIKAKDMKSDSPILSMLISMSLLGQSIDMELYTEDQWAYMVMGDMKYKTKAEDMQSEFEYAENMDDMLQQIPEELLKDVELVKAEDGSQSVTIAYPAEMFAQNYEELIGSLNSVTEINVDELNISDAAVKLTIADGYVTMYDVAFKMEMTVEGVSTTTDAKVTITYENPGQEVTVTPPEGYQDFEETDGALSW